MILLKQKIVFIHISKNAGSSVVSVLKPLAIPMPESIRSQLWKVGSQHSNFREYEQALGNRAKEIFFFSVVRNPWDRLVSLYHYWKTNRASHPYNCTEDGTDVSKLTWSGCTFNDWIKLIGLGYCGRHLAPQTDWICDQSGSLDSVQRILRMENLNADFPEMLSSIGLGQIELPKLNQSERGNYRDYYNRSSPQIVAERYCRDIQEFGYEF